MLEMKTEETKNQTEDSVNEIALSELHEPIWSVVSFEKVMHARLSYDEAVQKLQELTRQKVSGLCIITDNAAQKIAG